MQVMAHGVTNMMLQICVTEAWQHDGRPLGHHHVPIDFRGCASQCDQARHLIIITDEDVMLELSVQLLAAEAHLYSWSS